MSKDIYNEKVDIQLSESADIYMPHVKKVRGVIDGEEYELLINERDLPAGIAPSGATITKIIPWDQKFYMEWEMQGSPVFDIVVSDGGSEVLRVEEYPDKSGIFDQQSLANGIQYDLQVFAEVFNVITQSAVSNVTLFNATPTGLSLNVGSGTVTASWDAISQVAAWEVTLKDSDGNQVDKVTKLQGATSATLEGVEPYNNYTVELQAFSEGKVFSSSVISNTFNTQRVVYVAGFNELIAYSLEDGSQVAVTSAGDEWGEYGMDHDPVRNRLVTADEYGRIRCFDINSDWTISQIWSYLPTNDSAGNPIFDYEGDVYIGDYENNNTVIVKLDGSNGNKLWSTNTQQDDFDIRTWHGFGIHPLGIIVGAAGGKVGIISFEGEYLKTVTLPDDGGGILSTNYCRTPQCDEFGYFYVWSTGNPSSSSERGVGRYLDSKTSTPGATIDWFRGTGYNTHVGWIGSDYFSRLRRYGGVNVYRKDNQSYQFNVNVPDTFDEFRTAWDELHHNHGFDADGNLLYEDSDNGNNLSSRAPDGTLNWTVDIGTIYTMFAVPTSKPFPWTDTAADLSIEEVNQEGSDVKVLAWSSNPTIEYALYDQAGTTEVRGWQKSRTFAGVPAGTYTIKVRDRVQTTPITQQFTVASVASDYLFFQNGGNSDALQVVDVSDGSDYAAEQDAVYDGAGRQAVCDTTNGFIYTVGSNENYRQLDLDVPTGVITTPANWVDTSTNFVNYMTKIDSQGNLYVGGYSATLGSDYAIIRINSDGTKVWENTNGVSMNGLALHPTLGLLVTSGFNTDVINILDKADGSIVNTFQVKDTGGTGVGGRIVYLSVDSDGYIYASHSSKGVYRIDPSDFSTTHFHSMSPGAGYSVIGDTLIIVAKADGINETTGAEVLNKSDLSFVKSLNCTPSSVYSGSHNQHSIGIDSADNYFWKESGTVNLHCEDVNGNAQWTRSTPNTGTSIQIVPLRQQTYPHSVS